MENIVEYYILGAIDMANKYANNGKPKKEWIDNFMNDVNNINKQELIKRLKESISN